MASLATLLICKSSFQVSGPTEYCLSCEASIGSINLALNSSTPYVLHTLAVGLNGVLRSGSLLCRTRKGTCRSV